MLTDVATKQVYRPISPETAPEIVFFVQQEISKNPSSFQKMTNQLDTKVDEDV